MKILFIKIEIDLNLAKAIFNWVTRKHKPYGPSWIYTKKKSGSVRTLDTY